MSINSNNAMRRITAATEVSTGKFYCSSSSHMANGTPVQMRGRKICQACADRRKQVLKESKR